MIVEGMIHSLFVHERAAWDLRDWIWAHIPRYRSVFKVFDVIIAIEQLLFVDCMTARKLWGWSQNIGKHFHL